MRAMKMALIVATVTSVGLPAVAQQQMYFYPARGQSQYQQNDDEGQCHMWAVQQTGYNPFQASGNQGYGGQGYGAPLAGGMFRGAMGGAALGAVGGAIGGDAGKGAAIGAGVGMLFGGWRRHREMEEMQQQQQQMAYQSEQRNSNYQHALAACMTGRGYSVG